MRIKKLKLALISWPLLFVFSCLTINIYFPEAAVQKTAEEIVGEIRKTDKKDKEKKDTISQGNEIRKGSLNQRSTFSLVPSAYAQQREEQVSTPKIRALKKSLKERFPKLRPFFDKGNIGEANDGFISVRNETDLALREKASLRNLVRDENKDRKNLYAAVAKAMEIASKQRSRVQKVFARQWIQSAHSGWWIQEKSGKWIKKK
jgi:uncharacterized protein YdbL (DUF1318 family)